MSPSQRASRVDEMLVWIEANRGRLEKLCKGSLVFYIGPGDVVPELVEKFERLVV